MFFFSQAFFNTLINYPADLFSSRIYSLITSGFLHANPSLLFGNMLGIFIFGRVVERKIGFWKTLLVYVGALLISGIFSSLIDLIFTGSTIGGLGASGALMGLVATAILLDPFYVSYEAIIPLPIMVLGWITIYADIVGVLNPTNDGIGHFTHISGFISVAILMYFVGGENKSSMKKGLIINIISAIVGVLLYIFLF